VVLRPDPWSEPDTLAEVDDATGRIVQGCNLGRLHRVRYWATRRLRKLAAPVADSTDWAPFPDTIQTDD
jgi:hypothetical protein